MVQLLKIGSKFYLLGREEEDKGAPMDEMMSRIIALVSGCPKSGACWVLMICHACISSFRASLAQSRMILRCSFSENVSQPGVFYNVASCTARWCSNRSAKEMFAGEYVVCPFIVER